MFDNEKNIHDIAIYYRFDEKKHQYLTQKCNYISCDYYESFLERIANEILKDEIIERKMFSDKGIMAIRLKREGCENKIEIVIV